MLALLKLDRLRPDEYKISSFRSVGTFPPLWQVLWEKKLLDDTSILRNCLLKRGRRQARAAQAEGRGRLQGLRRRATELCFGHQRNKTVGRKLLTRPLSVTEMGGWLRGPQTRHQTVFRLFDAPG